MDKILIVEDNSSISKGLKYSLEQEGFEITIAPNGILAKKYIDNNKYNLIILDISLPDTSGFEICKYIKEKNDTKIIFLTAKESEEDVVKGFDLGADDYIIKPFRTRELISRINNILRRKKENNIIKNGNITIDIEGRRVFNKEKEITLTALEFNILELLYNNLNILIEIKNINIKIKGDEKIIYLGDYKWELEAITNIIKNCIEHSKDNSNIYIEYDTNNIDTKITIRDEGKGISKEDIKNIFKRFYKGKNSSEDSYGIGLSLAKNIIENDNGFIKVYSELDKGTTFEIKYIK